MKYRVPHNVQASFRELLGREKDENLAARFQFYCEQNPEMTEELLGNVPMIGQYGWAFVGIRPEEPVDEPFGFSIGFYFRYNAPEVLVLSPSLDEKAGGSSARTRACQLACRSGEHPHGSTRRARSR